MTTLMSYVRPLSWMAWRLLVKLGKHLLALFLGFIISIPLMYLMFWFQDMFHIRF